MVVHDVASKSHQVHNTLLSFKTDHITLKTIILQKTNFIKRFTILHQSTYKKKLTKSCKNLPHHIKNNLYNKLIVI